MSHPTPIIQTSRLLSLPAELRNMIYVLVLTTDETVLCALYQIEGRIIQRFRLYDEDVDKAAATQIRQINQMMFVCQQLYLETSDLVPKTPLFIFPQLKSVTESASVTCARFLATLSVTALIGFPDIALMERVPYNARALWTRVFDLRGVSALVDFCRAHPSIQVHKYLGALDIYNKDDFTVRSKMDMVHLAVRKHLAVSQLARDFDAHWSVKHMAKKWPCYGADAPAFPRNLKLRPNGLYQRDATGLSPQQDALVWKWFRDGVPLG